jgi:hypothetical protein
MRVATPRSSSERDMAVRPSCPLAYISKFERACAHCRCFAGIDAGRVTAWPREAGDKTELDRVIAGAEGDRSPAAAAGFWEAPVAGVMRPTADRCDICSAIEGSADMPASGRPW